MKILKISPFFFLMVSCFPASHRITGSNRITIVDAMDKSKDFSGVIEISSHRGGCFQNRGKFGKKINEITKEFAAKQSFSFEPERGWGLQILGPDQATCVTNFVKIRAQGYVPLDTGLETYYNDRSYFIESSKYYPEADNQAFIEELKNFKPKYPNAEMDPFQTAEKPIIYELCPISEKQCPPILP